MPDSIGDGMLGSVVYFVVASVGFFLGSRRCIRRVWCNRLVVYPHPWLTLFLLVVFMGDKAFCFYHILTRQVYV